MLLLFSEDILGVSVGGCCAADALYAFFLNWKGTRLSDIVLVMTVSPDSLVRLLLAAK